MSKVMKAGGMAGGLALAALILSGCTGPIGAEPSKSPQYPQVHMTNYFLQTWVKVTVPGPQMRFTGAQQLVVTVPLENLANYDMPIDYKYRFLNNGVEVEQASGWQHYVLPKRGTGELQFTSIVPTANDFDVEIRQSQ